MKHSKVQRSKAPNLEGLTQVQCDHVMRTFPETRASMADYLRQGVEVYIHRQDEVPDVPPVAIAVSNNTGYWIDCAESESAARTLAAELGLTVASD
ncbi:hypothetical protein D3C84_807210 [compost metagenome]